MGLLETMLGDRFQRNVSREWPSPEDLLGMRRTNLPSLRKIRCLLLLLLGTLVILVSCAQQAAQQNENTSEQARSNACPPEGRVLEGVYHPERLTVQDSCKTVTGTITGVKSEQDGDLHIRLALDPVYEDLLNDANQQKQGNNLVVEFMARDGNHLPEPKRGDEVEMTGAFVNDSERGHGWNELHPVWSVRINGGSVSTSGPQYGGSPAEDRSRNAAEDCRDENGQVCKGYRGPTPSAPSQDT
jgi:hypothetical protein